MRNDPIVEEVRQIREEYAKQFHHDLRAMAADLRKHEQDHRDSLVTFPPKPAHQRAGAT